MKKIFILASFLLQSCVSTNVSVTPKRQIADAFVGFEGCYLLYNLKTEKFETQYNLELCKMRESPCSTFKVPLALMAFDANILKDESTLYKWDGKKRFREVWNQDHTAASWMKESVLWYSQRLTPKLGMKRMKKYLQEFDYGNQDLSGGLQTSWLSSNDVKDSLKISPLEQLEFMKKWWTRELPVSKHAYEMTDKITYLETSSNGYALNGKTGSGYLGKKNERQLGWFIAHLQNGGNEYLSVVLIKEKEDTPLNEPGGFKAKAITKDLLTQQGIWK